ncbi:MAG: efflux RND transporter periplasmic adaptor subunit [Gammaproteobacteria bacterium]|nr:efflux RND transporter periplasmic adaptor subunit [Gammaproteobacteria bacterium]
MIKRTKTVSKYLVFWCLAAIHTSIAAEAPLATAVAAVRTVKHERILDGRVEAVNQSTVSAQTSGRVVEVLVDVDDFVEQNEVILQLSGIEQRAGVAQAEADVADAQARLAEANQRLARARRLFADSAVSRAEYDAEQANLETAKARLQSAEAARARAREEAGYTVVRAPYAGIVTARHVELGETVVPGQPLLSGFSLESLRVRVEVPQRLIHSIRTNMQARILAEYPEPVSVEAAEVTIFPHAPANTVPVWAVLPPGIEGFFPGMLVKVAFTIGERKRLVIPAQAIVYRSEVVGVYTVTDLGEISLRHIRTGHRSDDGMVEVLAGLDAGERVALDPARAVTRLKQTSTL